MPILIASLGDMPKARENVISVVVTLRGYCQTCLVLAAALGVDAKGKQSYVNRMVIFLHSIFVTFSSRFIGTFNNRIHFMS